METALLLRLCIATPAVVGVTVRNSSSRKVKYSQAAAELYNCKKPSLCWEGGRVGKVLNWKRWREARLAWVKGESEVKNGVKRWLPLIFYIPATAYVASGQDFLTVNLQYTCISKTLIFFDFD